MKFEKSNVQTSKIVPIVNLLLLPIAWVVAIKYNIYHTELLLASGLAIENLRLIASNKLELPLKELINMATVVITAIYGRKAIREATLNMNDDEDEVKEP